MEVMVTELRISDEHLLPQKARSVILDAPGLASGQNTARILAASGRLAVGAMTGPVRLFRIDALAANVFRPKVRRRRSPFGSDARPRVEGYRVPDVDGAIGLTSVVDDDGKETLFALSPWTQKVYSVGVDARGVPSRRPALASRVGDSVGEDEGERGRRLFFESGGSISQHDMSCASCHPEGREDGMAWRFAGDLRQTPMLAGRLEGTAPYHWQGTAETLEDSIKETITRLGGHGIPDDDRAALARFMMHDLKGPTVEAPTELARVQRGEALFRSVEIGCAGCHLPEADFTDGQKHDVGTGGSIGIGGLGTRGSFGIGGLGIAGLRGNQDLGGLAGLATSNGRRRTRSNGANQRHASPSRRRSSRSSSSSTHRASSGSRSRRRICTTVQRPTSRPRWRIPKGAWRASVILSEDDRVALISYLSSI